MNKFNPISSYIRVATATPNIEIANPEHNYQEIINLYNQASKNNVSLVVFPELCITGYSLGDLVRQKSLLNKSLTVLVSLAKVTANQNTALVVGLPISVDGHLYNVAALLANGKILGIVPKSNMPNYGEFYEQRWYKSLKESKNIIINDFDVPFSNNLLFKIGDSLVGIEICEDVWVANQPSRILTAQGALIIANLSASPELVGKADYRRNLIKMTSALQRTAYIYAGADWTESTTDIVMGGHSIICENGSVLAERKPFSNNQQLLIVDIDIDHLVHDRLQDTTTTEPTNQPNIIQTDIKPKQSDLRRHIPKSYFLPNDESLQEKNKRLSSIIEIQAHGLARRIQASGSKSIVLGLSGGLDSTLALIVAYKTSLILNKKPSLFVHCLIMPGPASSNHTQSNAVKLANYLQVKSKKIAINNIVSLQLAALKHQGSQDITYENTQARARTSLLFNYANQKNGLVLGTGDLSELASGWCTYGGDHLSNYNVNSSVPKTLVRDLVKYAADLPEFAQAKTVLQKIIYTPISPELTKTNNKISQQTEDIIGPYELIDFYLYHVLRYGDEPQKIVYLAKIAYKNRYSENQIRKWLLLFYDRFAKNQFKRSCLPDGPKVGSVSISPRGDWRMPSDTTASLWN